MQCSSCGATLPAEAPFCPNCGKPTIPTSPTTYNPPQYGGHSTNNEAVPSMDFGPMQEPFSAYPQYPQYPQAAPSYPPQPQSEQWQQPQSHMIFGEPPQQVYPPANVPPQYPQYQQYPQQSQPPQYPQQPATTFGPVQSYPQAGLPPQQPAMFVPGQPYTGTFPPPQQPANTFGQEQSYSSMGMPQQPGMFPQEQFAQPVAELPGQRRRSGPSIGIIILLVVLVIAIIGGGSIVLYTTVLLPAGRHAQTNATPTIQAKTPTPQATTPITTTNPQDLYTQVTSQTPTLNDPLTGQDNNNWQDLSTLKNCTFTGGALHISGASGSCIGEGTSFSNFAYQVKVTIIQGNLGGIAFRVDALDRKLYFFGIDPSGLYAVVYAGAGTSSTGNEKLLASASSSAITTGFNQQNTLMVIARGSSIFFYINSQYVTTITDSSITIGAIGMLAGNSTGSTSNVAFSDAEVWTL